MNMSTAFATDLCNMSDDEVLEELTRPSSDLQYKLYINSIALVRILDKLIKMEKPIQIAPYKE